MDLHELTAGYALDALDADEQELYEAHLASCEPCRDELQGFWQVSAALGRAAGGPQPPAVAAVAAIAAGIWAVGVSRDLNDANDQLAILGDPKAQVFESAKGEASLFVRPSGESALVVRQLAPAPAGKDYEIWVFEDGVPQRAGVFEGPGVATLTRPVEPGQMVAVTLEPDGGLDAPSGAPVFTASSA